MNFKRLEVLEDLFFYSKPEERKLFEKLLALEYFNLMEYWKIWETELNNVFIFLEFVPDRFPIVEKWKKKLFPKDPVQAGFLIHRSIKIFYHAKNNKRV